VEGTEKPPLLLLRHSSELLSTYRVVALKTTTRVKHSQALPACIHAVVKLRNQIEIVLVAFVGCQQDASLVLRPGRGLAGITIRGRLRPSQKLSPGSD